MNENNKLENKIKDVMRPYSLSIYIWETTPFVSLALEGYRL